MESHLPSVPVLQRSLSASCVEEIARISSALTRASLPSATWQQEVRGELLEHAELAGLRDQLVAALEQAPHAVALRGLPFRTFPAELEPWGVVLVSLLVGSVSDGNAYAERSGLFWEHVQPTRPEGTDVTYTLGECEAHSDESSKPDPEDLVGLWCVRPASDGGGTSRVWVVRDLEDRLRATPAGQEAVRVLRERWFPFGGKLRQPPRVLLAPILVGRDGIRYRAGAIADGFASLGRSATPEARQALDLLGAALRDTPPFEHVLKAGELLVALNRRTVHARSDFRDTGRHLLKVRGFSDHFAMIAPGSAPVWSDAPVVPHHALLA